MTYIFPKTRLGLKNKLKKIAKKSFENGLRLHFDSATLFAFQSYASAFFLSALAQEELGKNLYIESILIKYLDEEKMTTSEIQNRLRDVVFRDHSYKQLFYAISRGSVPTFEKYINRPRLLEESKLQALYVGFGKNKMHINVPSKNVTKLKCEKQILFLNSTLIDYVVELHASKRKIAQLSDDQYEKLIISALENTYYSGLIFVENICMFDQEQILLGNPSRETRERYGLPVDTVAYASELSKLRKQYWKEL